MNMQIIVFVKSIAIGEAIAIWWNICMSLSNPSATLRCSPVNKILTFDYRFPIGWGLLNWVLSSPATSRRCSDAS